MEGAVFPPPMERPSKAAAFAGGDRLLEGLATLGGTRLRQVNSGTTNRPTGRHVGQFTSYKHPSGAPMPMVRPSSVSSASSGASYHLGSRSTTPSSQSSRGDSANKPLTLKNRDDRLALRESHDKILGKRENDIRRVFRSMDSNRNGKLCATEIKEGLKAYNFGLTDLHVERLIKALDKDGDGSVSYDEFMQVRPHACHATLSPNLFRFQQKGCL